MSKKRRLVDPMMLNPPDNEVYSHKNDCRISITSTEIY